MIKRIFVVPAVILLGFCSCYVVFTTPFSDTPPGADMRLVGAWIMTGKEKESKTFVISSSKEGLLIRDYDPTSGEKSLQMFGTAVTGTAGGHLLLFVNMNRVAGLPVRYAPVVYSGGDGRFEIFPFRKQAFASLCSTGKLACANQSGSDIVVTSPPADIISVLNAVGVLNLIDKQGIVFVKTAHPPEK